MLKSLFLVNLILISQFFFVSNKQLIPNLEIPVKIPSQRIPFPFVRGPTPLVFSILYQRTDIFKYFLIEKNASLDVKVNGLYPIHYACAVGKLDIMQIILGTEKGRSQVNLPNDYIHHIFISILLFT